MSRFNLLPLPSGGTLLLSAHPASWPGLTPAQVLGVYGEHGVRTLVSLVSDKELGYLGLTQLPDLCRSHGLQCLRAPIADQQAPDAAFELGWPAHRSVLFDALGQGQAVALHCWAGLGRAGTVAARILMDREGLSAETAIAAVRQVRPGSIETAVQVDYLRALRPQ
jgi:ADP-ribosyl-[dinitrogen reductase] hydrolase